MSLLADPAQAAQCRETAGHLADILALVNAAANGPLAAADASRLQALTATLEAELAAISPLVFDLASHHLVDPSMSAVHIQLDYETPVYSPAWTGYASKLRELGLDTGLFAALFASSTQLTERKRLSLLLARPIGTELALEGIAHRVAGQLGLLATGGQGREARSMARQLRKVVAALLVLVGAGPISDNDDDFEFFYASAAPQIAKP